jgi:hypothetical protein
MLVPLLLLVPIQMCLCGIALLLLLLLLAPRQSLLSHPSCTTTSSTRARGQH